MRKEEFHRSFVLVKPDGYRCREEIIKIIKREGLKVEVLGEISVTQEQVDDFYPSSQEWLISVGQKLISSFQQGGIEVEQIFSTANPLELGKMVKGWIREYLSSGPTIGLVVSGENASFRVKNMVGPTEPAMACPGTIRGTLCPDDSILEAALQGRAVRNLVHVSGPEDAEREIEWFLKNSR